MWCCKWLACQCQMHLCFKTCRAVLLGLAALCASQMGKEGIISQLAVSRQKIDCKWLG